MLMWSRKIIVFLKFTQPLTDIQCMNEGDVILRFTTPPPPFAKMPNAASHAQSQTARQTDRRLRNEFITIFHLIKAGERVMQVRAELEIALAGWLSVFNVIVLYVPEIRRKENRISNIYS